MVTVSITINPVNTQNSAEVPEFPTIALPVISVIGLMFLMQRRKGE
ncbi:MAG TPA: PEF-CTERM sorting domain-containing protein [Methanosarcinaceae archaeon]|nr:PEF-CTERM sorting domain-containing protein [Methanosarcinaceae archaeon]